MQTGDLVLADELIQYLSWAVYVLIFGITLLKAIRRPVRANIDIALFFGSAAGVILLSVATQRGLLQPARWLSFISIALVMLMAYMMLRLIDDFTSVPRWVMRAAEVSLVALVVATFVYIPEPPATVGRPAESPEWVAVLMLLLGYLVIVFLYTIPAFWRASQRSSGVTRRRMRAVAIGSLWLVATLLISGLAVRFLREVGGLDLSGFWPALQHLTGLASAVSYYIGFATPGFLRRAWQEPELRAFLGRAASLPRLPTTAAIIREMEHGAASAVGAPNAAIGLWDEEAQVLRLQMSDRTLKFPADTETVAGSVFLAQKPKFTDDVQRDHPNTVALSNQYGARALLVAPITAGEKRLGVLVVYAPRAPIFADEDLALVQLLADQAAVILESRALIDEAARVRAREEVTRMKDDFLSAAAHDLKTPLTTVVAQAQLLERKAMRAPNAPADVQGLQKLVRETQRLKTLVLELLDAARAEQGRLVVEQVETDLAALARETCARHSSKRHPCMPEIDGEVVGYYDPNRIIQLMENLVENAIKYSPDGGQVQVKVWREDGWNRLSVADEGIGIPSADLPHVFDRFHRAANVDDRRFAGMGLGLFICKGIVEQHGGRIWADSSPGKGSTFHVALPSNEVQGSIAAIWP